MNWNEMSGKWTQIKGAAKEKWGKLTDDDLDVIDGKRERLVGKIQERYGVAKEMAEEQVSNWKIPAHTEERTPQRKAG